MKPLEGIRVLDLTNVLAGPFCCHQLAHMGADVIKVEIPETGDLARQLGADTALNDRLMGISFLAQNSGKRSLTINMKSAKGRDVFMRLVSTADVVVENFRPGVMERLGVGYEVLKAENPALIYCAISGFGQDGPMRNLPAYDQIIQGMSGVMSITGAPDNAPYRVGYPMADTIGGMTAAFAVSSALANRSDDRGCFIDVSMLEAVMASMGWAISDFLMADKAPEPRGNDNFTASPSGAFQTGDGLINIAANKQEQFEAVCRIVGRPEILTDPRFSTRRARIDNRAALTEILEEAMIGKGAAAWVEELNQAGVPAGIVLSVPEALAQPQIAGREMIGTFKDVPGVGRDVRMARTGIKLDGNAVKTGRPPPALGQHNDELLTELGFSSDEIGQLKEGRVI